jgi:class 3 adenylate cyclase
MANARDGTHVLLQRPEESSHGRAPAIAYHALVVAPLRPWHRLSVRVAALFVAVTLLGIALVSILVYERQKRELEETLGLLLLNIARTGALLVDPALHAEVQRALTQDSEAYRRVRAALAAIEREVVLPTPTYTLTDYDAAKRQARFMVTSRGPGLPGEPYPLVPELVQPLGRTFEDGVPRFTRIYHNQSGTWITAFAPIKNAQDRTIAVLDVDYPVGVYLDRLRELRNAMLRATLAGALVALVIGLLFARRITRPISGLTAAVTRVAGGDLSQAIPVRSADEVGRLTQAFNEMLAGLRQRDFIRDTFGRYVSPEVAKTLLESPEALRLGGAKREVTILMSDLRGYTRFAEQGDPQRVMEVLNGYLARMTEIIIGYGGTINEFIGDAIFAIFGAPLEVPDHAERAAATALAMQGAMRKVNEANAARDMPHLEMGIGVNTGEAVVGNIGSAQRAKYAVVGSAVNVAARVESATVGGQILISAATWERIRDLAEVGAPVPVAVKGLAEPLLLYELHGLRGRFAQRLPAMSIDTGSLVDVVLPLMLWMIDGKVVRAERLAGTVLRLGARELQARLDEALPPLTNVKLRLSFPGLGYDSGDLYGKIVGESDHHGTRLTRIRLTSLDADDQKVLETLVENGAGSSGLRPL